MPDSGTNHATVDVTQVGRDARIHHLDRMRVIWGDSDSAPRAPWWNSGLTTQLQGGALCTAADMLRQDLLQRAPPR